MLEQKKLTEIDLQTDSPTNRQTDRPTQRLIELPRRNLKSKSLYSKNFTKNKLSVNIQTKLVAVL